MTRILMIDNYDSFTYNLVQYLGELGAERHGPPQRRDRRRRRARDGSATRSSISPGPCTPKEAGISVAIAARDGGRSCRSWASAWAISASARRSAATVVRARTPDARQDLAHHPRRAGTSLPGLPNPFDAMRYHSLLVDAELDPECLEVSARTAEGEIMGLRHQHVPDRGRPVPSRVDRHAGRQTAAARIF